MIKIFWTHHLHVWTDSCSLIMSSWAAAGVCNGHIYFACAGYPQYSFWYVNHITHTTRAYHANPEFNERAHIICTVATLQGCCPNQCSSSLWQLVFCWYYCCPSIAKIIIAYDIAIIDRKSTRLNSSHMSESRMPSSAWKKKKTKKI